MNCSTIRITVLAENTAQSRDLLAEHGLAYWIEANGRHILFDTGQGHVLRQNASKLGIDLEAVEIVALSHGHYDHTGGLRPLLEVARPRCFVAHPDIFGPKFVRQASGEFADVGMQGLGETEIGEYFESVNLTKEPLEITPGVTFSGEIARTTALEDTGGAFFADAVGARSDPLNDDAALILDTTDGLVLLLGCAHSGVVNTLFHAQVLFGNRRIHAVIGGMHLQNALEERLDATLRALRVNAVSLIAAGHCTGWKACARFSTELGDHFRPLAVGMQFEFCLRARRAPRLAGIHSGPEEGRS